MRAPLQVHLLAESARKGRGARAANAGVGELDRLPMGLSQDADFLLLEVHVDLARGCYQMPAKHQNQFGCRILKTKH